MPLHHTVHSAGSIALREEETEEVNPESFFQAHRDAYLVRYVCILNGSYYASTKMKGDE